MARKNLLEFFRDSFGLPAEYLEYDNGFRRWTYTYSDTARAAGAFADRLKEMGVSKNDRVVLWSESRPEWIFAFWGSLLAGAVVVPIGSEASAGFVRKVTNAVRPRVAVLGEDVPLDGGIAADVLHLTTEDWKRPVPDQGLSDVNREDLAEIVFTSGSTGEPKGVEITHGNLLSQIEAVERSLTHIRKLIPPFLPIRFLQLLPLSHMFGQATTFSLCPLLAASTLITRQQSPAAIVDLIHQRRVTAAICVPKVFDVLRTLVRQRAPETAGAAADRSLAFQRLWRYRRVHNLFGWRFLGFMLGGAALDPELESFWSSLGYLVVQGYGLTETSPVVTLNNPLWPRKGSVGRLFPGVQLRVALDDEILVRGPNVTPGYYNDPIKTAEVLENGWFHTGDLGELDREGYLFIRGRKKEMIATPEGLKVFPEDVEHVLDKISGVRESAVIGLPPVGNGAQEQVYAVLRLEPNRDAHQVIEEANRLLEAHQRIRDVSLWPDAFLPRTGETGKLKRAEIRERIVADRSVKPPAASPQRTDQECAPGLVVQEIERRAGRKVMPDTVLDELGLSSVDRVELLIEFEAQCQRTIDESEFAGARTVGDLNSILERVLQAEAPGDTRGASGDFPAWNRSWPARIVRRVNLALWILPITRFLTKPAISGLENLDGVEPPVIFAANHESNLDGPLILAALTGRWPYRIAPAMYKEFFGPHFSPEKYTLTRRILSSVQYYLVTLLGNAFPIPQQESGVRATLRYAGDLISDGWSLLIFPEGERRPTGQLGAFQPGVGLLSERLQVPVIPIHLEGVDRVLPAGRIIPRPGPTRLTFGSPMSLRGDDPQLLSHEVEEAVKAL